MTCCKQWAVAIGDEPEVHEDGYVSGPYGQIEQDKDGTWSINGCCGGGCYVITRVKFCPFCGACVEEKR